MVAVELDDDFDNTFNLLDTNSDGKISFNEFVGAFTEKVALLNEENLQAAFNKLDSNGDGTIESKEITGTFVMNSL